MLLRNRVAFCVWQGVCIPPRSGTLYCVCYIVNVEFNPMCLIYRINLYRKLLGFVGDCSSSVCRNIPENRSCGQAAFNFEFSKYCLMSIICYRHTCCLTFLNNFASPLIYRCGKITALPINCLSEYIAQVILLYCLFYVYVATTLLTRLSC